MSIPLEPEYEGDGEWPEMRLGGWLIGAVLFSVLLCTGFGWAFLAALKTIGVL